MDATTAVAPPEPRLAGPLHVVLGTLLPRAEWGCSRDAGRARLLAALCLGLVASCAVSVAHLLVFMPNDEGRTTAWVVSAAALVIATAYLAARRGRADAAAALLVGVQIATPAAAQLLGSSARLEGASVSGWLSLAILTANAVLGPRTVLGVGAVAILVLLLVELTTGGHLRTTAEGALLLGLVTMALVVYTRHRDRAEAARRGELRERNAELEQLRASLEQRVEERTEALEQSTQRLRASCETLTANQELLIRTEKMAAIGRLSAGFAHELASPLGAVLASIDSVRELCAEYASSVGDPAVTPDDHREIIREMEGDLARMRAGTERAISFVRGIRAHTRDPGAAARERFRVGQVVADAAGLLGYSARQSHIRLEVTGAETSAASIGVPSRLNQAVTNLIDNAIDAIAETGREGCVRVDVAVESGSVALRVSDDGPGIAPDVLPRVFEPLFTTKPYGRGTGLGLAIVREIIHDELGGSIEVEASSDHGTTFLARLPIAGETDGP